MASLDSLLAGVPESHHRSRMNRTAVESAPEASALAPERVVEAPALSTLVKVKPLNRSSPELRASEAAVEAPAIPGPTTEAPQVEETHVEAPHVEAPRVEAGDVGIAVGQPTAAEDIGSSAPPPTVPAPVSTKTGEPRDVKLLIEQGRQFFDVGDLVAARILFLRAANAGDATAAVAMGETYDPVVLADRGVLGPVADLDQARRWYERAREMGSPEGPRRLEMLANR
jgi:TPR repeat protein